ncbi:acyloxyacyl hydrolase [Elusimicrobium posterum]|uniref:acyloxyacyl hydrolase n=1 Tax=Elusimicrobium posterum TaxID=3116653 RepID=UPI003C76A430
MGSELAFGERAFIGYREGKLFAEAYIKHYSNGGFAEKNKGDNFFGITAGYNF